jgi:hypothetical protein
MFSQTRSRRSADVAPVNFERQRSVTPDAILVNQEEVAERSRDDDVRRASAIVGRRQIEESRTDARSTRT